MRLSLLLAAAVAAVAVGAVACGGDDGDSITVYSGRSEALVQPIIDQFEDETGIDVEVKYAGTDQLAALLAEEGSDSPADVFFSQDGGALGAVRDAGLLEPLPEATTSRVPASYRAEDGTWVGVSGRSRVVVYNPDLVQESELPSSYEDLTASQWNGKVGWAPANASFQAFVTALREIEGEDAAKTWLETMRDNGTKVYPNNITIVQAVAAGEIEIGVVNHYYLWGFLNDQGEGFRARNHYLEPGDPGALVNVAGVAMLKASEKKAHAQSFVDYLLSEHAQEYFANETFEYPMVQGVEPDPRIKPLDELKPPSIDLSDLADLQGTLALLRSTSVLE